MKDDIKRRVRLVGDGRGEVIEVLEDFGPLVGCSVTVERDGVVVWDKGYQEFWREDLVGRRRLKKAKYMDDDVLAGIEAEGRA